ncbi:MAG: tRNA pseudouridine(55) synthase TruB [Pseudomonadota bacterium]
MGRKGRDVSGWVIVDKPAGIGSTQVVGKVRRAFDARKAGHAGTLDPAATGVLAVALGEATKTVPYVQDGSKGYRFAVRLGAETTTDDAEGAVTETSAKRPTDAEVAAALPAFRGEILQVPPRVSAVKVGGERAYALAREGGAMALAARPLHVERLEIVERPDLDTVILDMVCGKGGYVRSVARDLGAALGCLGHVLWLRRDWTGPFGLSDAVAMGEIERLGGAAELERFLLPVQAALADLSEVRATPAGAARLRDGNPGQVIAQDAEYGEEVWVSFQGRALAIGRYMGGEVHPNRVFNLRSLSGPDRSAREAPES